MKENVTAVIDQRIVGYSRLKRALEFKANIEESMQEREGTIHFTIADGKSRSSCCLEIGNDLVLIAQGAVFGAYRQLAYDTIFDKETGKEIRVINPVGKAIADGLIKDMSRQETSFGSEPEDLLLRVKDPRV